MAGNNDMLTNLAISQGTALTAVGGIVNGFAGLAPRPSVGSSKPWWSNVVVQLFNSCAIEVRVYLPEVLLKLLTQGIWSLSRISTRTALNCRPGSAAA
jgi:hypothetical protein